VAWEAVDVVSVVRLHQALENQPPVDTPVGDYIGYHVRSGGHDILIYDWKQFIRFANRHFNYYVK